MKMKQGKNREALEVIDKNIEEIAKEKYPVKLLLLKAECLIMEGSKERSNLILEEILKTN